MSRLMEFLSPSRMISIFFVGHTYGVVGHTGRVAIQVGRKYVVVRRTRAKETKN